MRLSKLCRQNIEEDSNSGTPLLRRFSCGVGHVMNDIDIQLLYSFRLVFFMEVLGLSAANVGWLMMWAFISSVISSVLAAFLIDKINLPYLSRKLGRRKSWHLIGTMIAAIIIPLYFSSCFPCQRNGGEWQIMIYVVMLNWFVSFSCVLLEIGHLSIIPVIAKDEGEAVELNAWRTAFTFLSGVVTYLVAWAILGQDSSDKLSTESSTDFSVMTLILVGIGLVFAVIFHVGTKEPSDESEESKTKSTANRKSSFVTSCAQTSSGVDNEGLDFDQTEFKACRPVPIPGTEKDHVFSKHVIVHTLNTNYGRSTPEIVANGKKSSGVSADAEPSRLDVTPAAKTAKAWLKDPHLYKVAFIYTCTFVVQNAIYGYLPFFFIYTLQLEKEAIAYLPLIMLISSAISSGISKIVIGKIGTKWCFIAAAFIAIGSSVLLYFITQSNCVMIYPTVVLVGFGFPPMMVNALSFGADLIGENKSSSGFVFAFMTLWGYLIWAAVITTIQHLFPQGSKSSKDCDECGEYVRHVIAFVPGSWAAVSLMVVLLFQRSKITRNKIVPRITAKPDAAMKTEEMIDISC